MASELAKTTVGFLHSTLSDWLSTLRHACYRTQRKTRLSRRVGIGQTLPDGVRTRRVTIKGFQVHLHFIVPLRQAS